MFSWNPGLSSEATFPPNAEARPRLLLYCSHMKYTDVLKFWFEELDDEGRFGGGEEMDKTITERFTDTHTAAAAGELWSWRENAEGALAEIIVLDQFSRNIYRGEGKAFAADNQALTLAQVAIEKGFDQELPEDQRLFIYMPFMHSESKLIHVEALKLFEALGNEGSLKYEKVHKEIIDRFGRYPHRNEQLGRAYTEEEKAYLEETEHDFFKS